MKAYAMQCDVLGETLGGNTVKSMRRRHARLGESDSVPPRCPCLSKQRLLSPRSQVEGLEN